MNISEFSGRLAFVTGGNRGIGKAIVKLLLQKGARVIFTYRSNAVDLTEYHEGDDQLKENVFAYEMDLLDRNSVVTCLKTVRKQHGKIDYLVNNAGVVKDDFLMMMSQDSWDQVIQTDLTGVFMTTKEVKSGMMKSKSGAIVNISSVAGLIGVAGQTNYCSAKAGVIGFTKALANEVAFKNIRVNAIAPGYIETDMTANMPSNTLDKLVKDVPLKRIGSGLDIANATLFLLSESSSYITGVTLTVDGGLTC